MGTIIAIVLMVLGLLSQTTSSPNHCTELTRKGQPCKNRSAKGNPHQVCGTHAAQLEREMAPKTLRVGLVAHPQRDFLQKFKTDLGGIEAEVSRVLDVLSRQYALEGLLSGNQTEWELARWAYRAGRPYDVLEPFKSQDANWPPRVRRAYQALVANARSARTVSRARSGKPGSLAWAYTRSHQAVAHECDLLIAAWWPGKSPSSVEAAVKFASERGIPRILIELDGHGKVVRTVIRGEGECTP